MSELWWVTAAQGPVRLLTGMPGRRFCSVATTGDDLFVEVYTEPEPETAHTVRVLAVCGVEDVRDAVPDLSGSVHQVIAMSERRRVVLWSEDPNLTQQVLIEGDHGWETLTPELRVAGQCQRIDARGLLIPAYDGVRAGMIVTRPGDASWRWALRDPVASLLAGFGHDVDRWRQAGFAALAPEYAAAGIGGSQRRSSAWMNPDPPGEDPNVEDIASAIAAPETKAIAANVFLFGWSWGGFVVNRLVTTGTPYRAAACWEGVADHRILDARVGGDPFRRTRWGTPAGNRDAWELASPLTQAGAVRTPMLLLYGEDGCPEQGEAWHAALYQAGVPSNYESTPAATCPPPYRRGDLPASSRMVQTMGSHRNG